MNTKEMPDWMMDYVASVNSYESYQDFRNLSKSYHKEIDHYLHEVYPQKNASLFLRIKTLGLENKPFDPKPDLQFIDEKYKAQSLKIACKYGYQKPSEEKVMTDNDLTKLQEQSSKFQKVIKDEDKLPDNASLQDEIAKEAHKAFFEKHPHAKENFKQNKEKCRADEKFDIELEKEGNLAGKFIDRLPSSKKEKDHKTSLEPNHGKTPDIDNI